MEVKNELLYLFARSILEKLRDSGAISQDEFEAADIYNADMLHIKTVIVR